ncbi:hypothetical protein Emtol_1854 [Emticicia oligotrophica DSM 17448]|uniref:YD repeat-containing protein n=1 Tax=Emticicia oligotrophica (strain DSM 17448 / CIP 109782 / MTCC 6937 / GPTSA100-15) TaxID=929562 RepID=A0ABN4AL85_EMTOG|nr:hypothetical protein [Emticicia oligotrophica]AFK02996.1 hypothetical protein Emtol_1854 [Emticicia oligotrophica DSM 17448]
MKFIKIVLGLFPFLASAQTELVVASNCSDTKYTFYRQGLKEQEVSKTYDVSGKLLKEFKSFSSKNTGNYSEEYLYTYDISGKNNSITYKRNNEVLKVTKKEYDAKGQVLKESVSKGLNLLSSNTLSNDGTEKVAIFFAEDGKTEAFREVSTSNAKGQVLSKILKDQSGKVLISDLKTYNSQGKPTQEVHFDATDKTTTQTDYVYDAKGLLLRDKTLRNNEVFAETKYAYDEAGKLAQKTRINGKGQIDYYFTYEYDVKGQMTKENYFYNNEVIAIRTFEYDLKGNKIKEIYSDKSGNVSMYKTWEFACK